MHIGLVHQFGRNPLFLPRIFDLEFFQWVLQKVLQKNFIKQRTSPQSFLDDNGYSYKDKLPLPFLLETFFLTPQGNPFQKFLSDSGQSSGFSLIIRLES